MKHDLKILFMGTPEIAATVLAALLEKGIPITGVVTREDKPRGRGGVLTPPPVKNAALAYGLPVCQPKTLSEPLFRSFLDAHAPDMILVVAYGKILPPDVIRYPKYGCINLHVSLLPRYRGAAPMQRAVMNGDTETGVTTMQMDDGLDTGDILLCERFPIGKEDSFLSVHDKSAAIGGPLLIRTIEGILDGSILPQKQPTDGVCYADKIEKRDALLDFRKSAERLDCEIRGLYPFPLAYTCLPSGRNLKIVQASPVDICHTAPCGRVLSVDGRGEGSILIACGEGALCVTRVKPEGKGEMPAGDFVRGRGIAEGDCLGDAKG